LVEQQIQERRGRAKEAVAKIVARPAQSLDLLPVDLLCW
jgi:hypothetical protein